MIRLWNGVLSLSCWGRPNPNLYIVTTHIITAGEQGSHPPQYVEFGNTDGFRYSSCWLSPKSRDTPMSGLWWVSEPIPTSANSMLNMLIGQQSLLVGETTLIGLANHYNDKLNDEYSLPPPVGMENCFLLCRCRMYVLGGCSLCSATFQQYNSLWMKVV